MPPWPLTWRGAALALLLVLPLSRAVWVDTTSAVPGVNATHIVIGQTAPFSGLQAEYGTRLAAGLRAAFAEANKAGGVQGRNLTLLALDDGYRVNASLANFPLLSSQALLLTSVYGSAINGALLPLMLASGTPGVGPYTGAAVTRFPFHEEMVNVRASYTDEMVVQAILLVERLRVHRVACFYQNDAFGLTARNGMAAALQYVGLQLVVAASYPTNTLDIEAALEAIAGQSPPVQAVVMASLEEQNVKFLTLFRQDNRTDPNCTFLFISAGVTAAFAARIGTPLWPDLYFTHVVPPLDHPSLPVVTEFQRAAALAMPPGLAPDHLSFEGYINGRLIAQVLRGIPGALSRPAFLEQLYSTRLFAFGGLLAGLYSRNFTGCEQVVCASSIGLRAIFPATLHPVTGAMHYDPALGHYTYPITELSFPVTQIVRPLLFGQLLPLDDPVWRGVAEAIGRALQTAFAAFNAAGGVDGRPVQLVQRYYTGDPAPAAAALTDRYLLLGLVGSVVGRAPTLQPFAAQLGTYQTDPPAVSPPFNVSNIQVQASLPLEIMALAAFAQQLGQPVHLRAPNTPEGEAALLVMVRSLHSLQLQPASTRSFGAAADALQGLSAGTVLATGTDDDVWAWFLALGARPPLRLLTPGARAVHLLASLNVASYPQASRLHYPSMFGPDTLLPAASPTIRSADLYGHLLGTVLTAVLQGAGNASQAYTTTGQVLAAWYGKQLHSDGVTLGPYYAAACAAGAADCECNEGVRQVTVLAAASAPGQPAPFVFSSPTCMVQYRPLVVAEKDGLWYVGAICGVVAGLLTLGLFGWWFVRRGQRDNAAAPKSASEPFCILFTDIQSSTHLWATIPDVMTTALHIHHGLIRQLLGRHGLYEVKTLGDSFMCAARSPTSAVKFAVALQRELFDCDWGTERIETAYLLRHDGSKDLAAGGAAEDRCWNGLRVRIGIHFGTGDVVLDPVSRGYDYYGTVVNIAARVEAVAHGGQTCVTQAVHSALNGEFPGAVVADLGYQILRGLNEPVHLYQLVPVELSGRSFPSLRLERCAEVEVAHRRPSEGSSRASRRSAVVPLRAGQLLALRPQAKRSSSFLSQPAASYAMSAATHWAECNPLVGDGRWTREELTARYDTTLRVLTRLLESQTGRAREVTLRGFCERLHVTMYGTEGSRLEETVHGLVQRLLPAALNAITTATFSRPPSLLINDCTPDEPTQCTSPISLSDQHLLDVATGEQSPSRPPTRPNYNPGHGDP